MVPFQIPEVTVDQIANIGKQLPTTIPNEYLPSLLVFSLIFFALSMIKFNIKLRIIAGMLGAGALAASNFVPAISKYLVFMPALVSITDSLGQYGTLVASAGLVVLGFVFGKLSHKLLLRKAIKKSGEPTPKLEHALEKLEEHRDHLIKELQHAKGDPVHEMKIEKKINAVNEKINVLKAKLGLPITA